MQLAFLVARIFPSSDEMVGVYELSEGDAVHAQAIVDIVNGPNGPQVHRKCKGTLRVVSGDELDANEREALGSQVEKSRDEYAAAFPKFAEGTGTTEGDAYLAPVCRNCYFLRKAVDRCLRYLRREASGVKPPASSPAREPEASPADQAFGAAHAFVEHLATLAYHARHFQPRPDKPDAWQDPAMTYAMAFVAWFDLSHLLTPEVRTQARRVYPPGSPAIKLGKAKPTPTVIEAVADELGVYFRNTVYGGRLHPLEPDRERVADGAKARATARQVAQGKPAEPIGWGADFDELMTKETRAAVRERLGIKTLGDGWMLMVDEWKKQDRNRGESALSLLRCESIDFDDLKTQLIREAEAVIAAASKPNAPPIDLALLARLEATAAAIPAVLEENRAGFERVAGVIESLGARDDDDTPAVKLPKLKPRDMQVWQVYQLLRNQTKVAERMNQEYPDDKWEQPRVSEAIKRAKAHVEASGLADKVSAAKSRAPARTFDPSDANMGQRTDGRSPHLRDTAKKMEREQ